MRTPFLSPRLDADGPDKARALRLIRKIEERYGLGPSTVAPQPAEPAGTTLGAEQMLVNEALVAKIFQCERAEMSLRESQQNLHDLLIHQLQLKEEERKRISVEIHDALGQNLLALRLDVVTLSQATGQNPPGLQAWVGAALSNIDGAIVTVRTLIAALRPFEIELGLEAAVEYELSQFRRTSGIAIHLSFDAAVREIDLNDQQILTIYRVLQECLSNVARHARATRVDVVVRALPSAVTMVVSDNGVGLERASRAKRRGYGLHAVRERLAALGGKLTLKGVSAHGTSVSVAIPLAAPQAATVTKLSAKMTT